MTRQRSSPKARGVEHDGNNLDGQRTIVHINGELVTDFTEGELSEKGQGFRT